MRANLPIKKQRSYGPALFAGHGPKSTAREKQKRDATLQSQIQ